MLFRSADEPTIATPLLAAPETQQLPVLFFAAVHHLLLSGADVTAHEFADHAAADKAWAGALQREGLTRVDLPGADHTFSDRETGARVLTLTSEWLRGPAGPAA